MVTSRIEPWHAAMVSAAMVLLVLPTEVRSATTRQLMEVVDLNGLATSPDGRLLAFRTEQASIERNTRDTIWYVQPVDGSAPPRRLGEGGIPLRDNGAQNADADPQWAPDSKWIYYRAMLDGRLDVWRAAVDGSRTERVTRDAADVRRFYLDADGSVLNYSVGATRDEVLDAELEEYDNGIRIDRSVPLGDHLFRSAYQDGRLTTQRFRDSGLEYSSLLSEAPEQWKAMTIATGAKAPLPPGHGPPASLKPADLPVRPGEVGRIVEDPGSGRIAFTVRSAESGGRSEQVELAMLAGRKDGHPVKCAMDLCLDKKITAIQWQPGSDDLIFTVTNDALGQTLLRWNVVTGDVLPVTASDGHLGGGGRWDPGPCAAAREALLCVTAAAGQPPRLERVDLQSGERRVLFAPNEALASDVAQMVAVRPISWQDALGRQYTGQFYPATTQDDSPPPLFITYYRCAGFVRGGMGDEWPLATLARSGVAALCINAAPYRDDAIERYEQGRLAVESAVGHLADRGEVDPQRVGMGGQSFGAEVAMWTAMNSRVLRTISLATPVVSPSMLLLFGLWDDVHYPRLKRYWQLGTVEETPERWRTISPSFDPERVRVPVLMQMAEQEYRFALDYAVPMIRAGRADAYVFPHESHQKSQPRHKLAAYERNMDWLRFWLLDVESEDPVKMDQYARWREMRKQVSDASPP